MQNPIPTWCGDGNRKLLLSPLSHRHAMCLYSVMCDAILQLQMNPNSIENVNQKENCSCLCSNKDWSLVLHEVFYRTPPCRRYPMAGGFWYDIQSPIKSTEKLNNPSVTVLDLTQLADFFPYKLTLLLILFYFSKSRDDS